MRQGEGSPPHQGLRPLYIGALQGTSSLRGVSSTWGVGNTADRATRASEYDLERVVSSHIGAMPFLWLEVDDPPSPASDRGVIEAGAISLLSNLGRPPIDPSSPTWLGSRADRVAIRGSGLWNVNHTGDPSGVAFLEQMAYWVRRS